MTNKVQCVPGGHRVHLEDAYWCEECEHYLCYEHARTSILVKIVKCPKGHGVSRAG